MAAGTLWSTVKWTVTISKYCAIICKYNTKALKIEDFLTGFKIAIFSTFFFSFGAGYLTQGLGNKASAHRRVTALLRFKGKTEMM